jgi:hypothetical protein
MSIESSSDDGSDVFWPGYVDAVTNLVLNLLFMLTIMIVAVFMFALELSRHKDQPVVDVTPPTEKPLANQAEEIAALQKQIELLKQQALIRSEPKTNQKVVTANTPLAKPEKDLRELTSSGGGVIVNFVKDAVVLSAAEAETLRVALGSLVASGGARVEVLVPTGFSEAKRIGFYRVMAVRNQLIGLGLPADKIEVQIRDGAGSAENSRVMVSPR